MQGTCHQLFSPQCCNVQYVNNKLLLLILHFQQHRRATDLHEGGQSVWRIFFDFVDGDLRLCFVLAGQYDVISGHAQRPGHFEADAILCAGNNRNSTRHRRLRHYLHNIHDTAS